MIIVGMVSTAIDACSFLLCEQEKKKGKQNRNMIMNRMLFSIDIVTKINKIIEKELYCTDNVFGLVSIYYLFEKHELLLVCGYDRLRVE